ncbi:hypothetical protein GF342_04125 [Candidatus Woesearchaeota archaeon]|nr:hypothetical protein [Candidatus Woesearchaeota archaeon]
MKKSVLMILLLAFLAGCGYFPSGGGGGGSGSLSSTQGLVISFDPSSPPSQVHDNDQTFDVGVIVENRGSYETTGTVTLRGFDPRIITGVARFKTTGLLDPVTVTPSLSRVEGGSDYLAFSGTTRPLSSVGLPTDKYEFPLQATVCYVYDTIASAEQLCVDPDPRAVTSRSCVVPSSLPLTSAAPVKVNIRDIAPTKGETTYVFEVSDGGGGIVFATDAMNSCANNNLQRQDIGKVKVLRVSIGADDITGSCTGLSGGYLAMSFDQQWRPQPKIFRCTHTPASDGAYSTSPTVILEYGYMQSITKQVQIVAT